MNEPAKARRVLEVPEFITDALQSHAAARAVFEKLPDSHKKEYVDWLAGAKREETRAARLAKFVSMLLAKQRQ